MTDEEPQGPKLDKQSSSTKNKVYNVPSPRALKNGFLQLIFLAVATGLIWFAILETGNYLAGVMTAKRLVAAHSQPRATGRIINAKDAPAYSTYCDGGTDHTGTKPQDNRLLLITGLPDFQSGNFLLRLDDNGHQGLPPTAGSKTYYFAKGATGCDLGSDVMGSTSNLYVALVLTGIAILLIWLSKANNKASRYKGELVLNGYTAWWEADKVVKPYIASRLMLKDDGKIVIDRADGSTTLTPEDISKISLPAHGLSNALDIELVTGQKITFSLSSAEEISDYAKVSAEGAFWTIIYTPASWGILLTNYKTLIGNPGQEEKIMMPLLIALRQRLGSKSTSYLTSGEKSIYTYGSYILIWPYVVAMVIGIINSRYYNSWVPIIVFLAILVYMLICFIFVSYKRQKIVSKLAASAMS